MKTITEKKAMGQLVHQDFHVWAVVGTLRNEFLKTTNFRVMSINQFFPQYQQVPENKNFRITSINHFFQIAPENYFNLNKREEKEQNQKEQPLDFILGK